nr:MAG TPA: hypothetical protein [Caudoviricetes sp.]
MLFNLKDCTPFKCSPSKKMLLPFNSNLFVIFCPFYIRFPARRYSPSRPNGASFQHVNYL